MSTLLDEALSAISVRRGLEERIFELEDEVARLRAERDAAREEVERLRGKLDFAQKSIPFDFVVGAGQLVQERDAARAAARAWKRAAKLWRLIAIDQAGTYMARHLFKFRKGRTR